MTWILRIIEHRHRLLDEKTEGEGGAGPDKDKEIADLKAKLTELQSKLTTKEQDPKDDMDLVEKARLSREQNEGKAKHEKSLEAAITFNHSSKDFLKTNSTILPKTIEGVFTQAEKETYDSSIEKANAIKAGIVSEFFAVQANHDLLTASQKIELDEFLKLTKNGKQEKVESVYAMIFEPTLEMLKKIEKAKQLRIDPKNQGDAEKAYVDRMHKLSMKHYLGVTKNA